MDETIQALLRERAGYVLRGRVERVAAVDAALKAAGYVPDSESSGVVEAAALGPAVRRAGGTRGRPSVLRP